MSPCSRGNERVTSSAYPRRASSSVGRSFTTERRIGDAVKAGDIVGAIGSDAVEAPACGVLIGLVARGARIEPGDALVEVDRNRLPHACHGIAEGPRKTALRVLAECKVRLGSSSCCNTPTSESESHVMHEEHTP